MFLLNRLAISAAPKAVIKFTSHYVPIKSTFLFIVLFLPIYLHPIMFLLNRHVNYNILVQLLYLHPIMFLLNRTTHTASIYSRMHLHPIMFLLNHKTECVSRLSDADLHPIMFLLNLQQATAFFEHLIVFTSHYVPIKSFN